MQPTLCSRCHKNVAVIFIQKMEGGTTKSEGLCLKCAKEMGIKPVEDMIQKMGITDEDLEGLTNEMMSAFGGAEGMEGLMSAEEADEDEEDEDDSLDFIEYECPHCGASVYYDQSAFDLSEEHPCPSCGKELFPETPDEDE